MIKKINYIHHISDIHIRNYKRHEEYNRVFDNLYKTLKESVKEDHLICLTGDIVHSKTDVSPELFNEVQKFLYNLCNIAPVLLIPGNHDANLNNSHRMDALTPIVNALENKNLIYFKNSEIIELGGLKFYHWSVFDDQEKYQKPNQEDTSIKICLFHGAVNNSTTEMGFVLENEKITVESFNGFDMVLLGDIHKLQYLNKEKTVAYPGSLIQQNHGEELNHGYLLWDVRNKSSKYIQIDNDTAFYTIEVNNGLYEPISDTIPKNVYLRIRYKNTDQSIIQAIVAEIKKERNIVELSTQRVTDFIAKESTISHTKGLDFRAIDQQRELLSKFLKQNNDLKEEDLAKIHEINDTVNKNLSKSDIPRNSMWIPKHFQFDNMFSYGQGNFVDFTNMKGAYGVFAPNASGKSTMLDALTYCIFDKCTKTNRGHQVMNSNSSTFYCKLNFELNGLDYFIERDAKRQNSGNVRVEVDFYFINEQGKKVSLNGKDRSDTNNNIKNLLGNYEDFVLTTLSTQNNNTGFIDMNQKDRKDLLSQFMDIGVFEEMYNVANDMAKDTSAVLRHYQKTDYEQKLSEYEKSLKEDQHSLEEISKLKSKFEKAKNDLNQKIINLATKLESVDNSIIDESALNKQANHSKNNIELLKEEEEKLESYTKEIVDIIKVLDSKLGSIDEEALITREKFCLSLKDKLHSADIEVKQLESHMNHKNDKMDKLKELKYDPNCKFCMENIFVKDAINTKNEIKEDQDTLRQLKHKKSSIEIQLSECEDAELDRMAFEKLKKDLAQWENKLIYKNSELETTKNKKLREEITLGETISKLELRKKQVSTIESNKEINSKIENTRQELSDVEVHLKNMGSDVTDLSVKIKITEKNINDTKSEIAKRKDLESVYKYYQHYLNATHRDGIPHDIISVTIPQIEEEVNNILSQLVDFKIVFETDDKNINAYISYGEDKMWPLELTSGMEKFVSSLAIRASLINISTLPRPNFIAIDEGFGSLDKSNLSSMSLLFEYLKTQFKFLVIISHIDSMRDIVDSHIDIHKINGKSCVKHQ